MGSDNDLISSERRKASYVILVALALPTGLLVIDGAGLIWTAFFVYSQDALLLLLVFSGLMVVADLFRFALVTNDILEHHLREDTRLVWMRLHNLFAVSLLSDFIVFLVTLLGSRYNGGLGLTKSRVSRQ